MPPPLARTNSFWMPLGPRHPLKVVVRHRSTLLKNLFSPLIWVNKLDKETYNQVTALGYVYGYLIYNV